ncbi:MAG: hypothetical protein R3Y62_00925 [Eubacteriales bacterium]
MNPALLARKRRLASDPQNRLKWRILWGFGVLPTEPRAQELDDEAIIDCALHMILDGEKQPAMVENANFDMEKFLAQGGSGHGTE